MKARKAWALPQELGSYAAARSCATARDLDSAWFGAHLQGVWFGGGLIWRALLIHACWEGKFRDEEFWRSRRVGWRTTWLVRLGRRPLRPGKKWPTLTRCANARNLEYQYAQWKDYTIIFLCVLIIAIFWSINLSLREFGTEQVEKSSVVYLRFSCSREPKSATFFPYVEDVSHLSDARWKVSFYRTSKSDTLQIRGVQSWPQGDQFRLSVSHASVSKPPNNSNLLVLVVLVVANIRP